MRLLISLLLGITAATGAFAHDLAGGDNLFQLLHAASSPHHWNGLLLLIVVAALLYRFLRRASRTD